MADRPSDRILELLYDRGDRFVFADELRTAASRPGPPADPAALDDALAELSERGHRFERSPAGQVRLLRPTVLDAALVERRLPVRRVGRHVICFGEVGSTNDLAFDCAAQAGGESLVVTAECQRAGRGRLGRRWQCPPGAGVLASVLLAGGQAPPQEAMTIAAGLAVAEGIEQATGVTAGVEWPNDVTVRTAGREEPAKVAGVLVETRRAAGRRRMVVGFGVNVTAAPPPTGLRRPAAALADAACWAIERIDLLRCILVRLDEWLGLLETGHAGLLHERWVARCDMLGRRLSVRSDGRVVTGRVLDVSPLEGLALMTDDGRRLHLPAARSTLEV